jgi:hypothetical protein
LRTDGTPTDGHQPITNPLPPAASLASPAHLDPARRRDPRAPLPVPPPMNGTDNGHGSPVRLPPLPAESLASPAEARDPRVPQATPATTGQPLPGLADGVMPAGTPALPLLLERAVSPVDQDRQRDPKDLPPAALMMDPDGDHLLPGVTAPAPLLERAASLVEARDPRAAPLLERAASPVEARDPRVPPAARAPIMSGLADGPALLGVPAVALRLESLASPVAQGLESLASLVHLPPAARRHMMDGLVMDTTATVEETKCLAYLHQ